MKYNTDEFASWTSFLRTHGFVDLSCVQASSWSLRVDSVCENHQIKEPLRNRQPNLQEFPLKNPRLVDSLVQIGYILYMFQAEVFPGILSTLATSQ